MNTFLYCSLLLIIYEYYFAIDTSWLISGLFVFVRLDDIFSSSYQSFVRIKFHSKVSESCRFLIRIKFYITYSKLWKHRILTFNSRNGYLI